MSQPLYTSIAIDDDPLFLEQLESFIEEIDWLSLTEKHISPVKAATAIIRRQPDVLFLDIEMPHVDGYELLDWIQPKLKDMDPYPHVVIISAVKEKLHNYEKRQIHGMIYKPDLKSPQDLERLLRSVLKIQ